MPLRRPVFGKPWCSTCVAPEIKPLEIYQKSTLSTMNPQFFLGSIWTAQNTLVPPKSPCFFLRSRIPWAAGTSRGVRSGAGGLHPDLCRARHHDLHGHRGAVDRQHQLLVLKCAEPCGPSGWLAPGGLMVLKMDSSDDKRMKFDQLLNWHLVIKHSNGKWTMDHLSVIFLFLNFLF